jgi:hypothetical protein
MCAQGSRAFDLHCAAATDHSTASEPSAEPDTASHESLHVRRRRAAAESDMTSFIASKLGVKYAEDLRTITFTCAYFILFAYMWLQARTFTAAGCWSLLFIAHVPLWLTLCYLSFLGAVATHNCIHCPMFHNRILNRGQQRKSPAD